MYDMVLGARGLLLLFDAQGGTRLREVITLELAQQGQDFIVGEQSRATVYDLVSDACQQAIGVQDAIASAPPSQATRCTKTWFVRGLRTGNCSKNESGEHDDSTAERIID